MARQIENCAVFSSSFSDDAEWNESGDLIVPGGRAIAVVLAECLTDCCFSVRPATQHSFYAWLVVVQEGKVRVECYLHDLQPWLLVSKARGSLLRRAMMNDLHRRVIASLKTILKEDDRFFDISWGTEQSLQSQGKLDGR